ncbi:hypothetical protein, partial [Burkholderia pseudomallei]
HHLEFVLRGHGRLQHHAIKKQKPPTWRGFVSNLRRLRAPFFMRDANAMRAARKQKSEACACILALAWRPLPIRRRSRGPAIVRRPRRIRRSVVVRP